MPAGDERRCRLFAGTARPPFEITGGPSRMPLEEAGCRHLLDAARACADGLGAEWPGSAAVGGIRDGNLCTAAGTPMLDGVGAVEEPAARCARIRPKAKVRPRQQSL